MNMQNVQPQAGRMWPLYSSSTETKAHACFFIPASVLVSIVNSRSNLQNQILSIRSWKAPSEIPGGRMNTQSWRLVCCNFFGVIGQQASLEHTNISNMIHLTLVTACIKRFPELIDNVWDVAKANISQTDRVNLEALAFTTCRLCLIKYWYYVKYVKYV